MRKRGSGKEKKRYGKKSGGGERNGGPASSPS